MTREHLPVALISALVVIQTIVLAQTYPLDYDESIYLDIASQISQTGFPQRSLGDGGPFLNNPPLVTYVAAAVMKLFGDDLAIQRTCFVILWMIPLVAGTAWLAHRSDNRWASLIAVMTLAGQSILLRDATRVKLDVPLGALSVLFLCCVHTFVNARSRRTQMNSCIGFSVLAALACLVKYQGVLLPAAAMLYFPYFRWRSSDRWSVRFPEVWIILACGVAGIIWIAVSTAAGGSLFDAVVLNSNRLAGTTTEVYGKAPLRVFLLGLLLVCTGLAATVSLLLALIRYAWKRQFSSRFVLALVWTLLCLAFCSSIALKYNRYFYCALPAIAVLISESLPRSTRRFPDLFTGAVLGVLSLGILLHGLQYWSRTGKGELNRSIRLIGESIRDQTADGDRILLTNTKFALFSNRNYYLSQYTTEVQDLIDQLSDEQKQITCILAIDGNLPQLHPTVSQDDRDRLSRYISEHFQSAGRPVPGMKLELYLREVW